MRICEHINGLSPFCQSIILSQNYYDFFYQHDLHNICLKSYLTKMKAMKYDIHKDFKIIARNILYILY